METTFGPTIQTRRLKNDFNNINPSDQTIKRMHVNYSIEEYLKNHHNQNSRQLFQKLETSEFNHEMLKKQYDLMMKKRQKFPKTSTLALKSNSHIASASSTNSNGISLAAPSSAILIRKSFNINSNKCDPDAIFNSNIKQINNDNENTNRINGYCSDSECYHKFFNKNDKSSFKSFVDKNNNLFNTNNYQNKQEHQILSLIMSNRIKKNIDISNKNISSLHAESFFSKQDEDSILGFKRSQLSNRSQIRTNSYSFNNNNNYYDGKRPSLKSVKLDQNRVFKPILNNYEKSTATNNINSLFSPKISIKSNVPSASITIYNNNNKNNTFLSEENEQIAAENNFSFDSYLNWKNKNYRINYLNEKLIDNNNYNKNSQSISTPATPLLSHSSSLPR
jgi:hypothetical protein